ncbi:acylphosphatase [Candidatus Woesearchaeota archaeon]|nr:acylphosphatase [Candidatus Woesearchaeota archaeon]
MEDNNIKACRVLFSGRVQGVFFRANAKKKAVFLELKGYVKNLDSGDVEMLVIGNAAKVDALISYCINGQPYAKVEKTSIKRLMPAEADPDKYKGFEIRQ